jgi:hypothetical protein
MTCQNRYKPSCVETQIVRAFDAYNPEDVVEFALDLCELEKGKLDSRCLGRLSTNLSSLQTL